MYECFSPQGAHKVTTDLYSEACFYAWLGYTVFDWHMTTQRANATKPKQTMHRAKKAGAQ